MRIHRISHPAKIKDQAEVDLMLLDPLIIKYKGKRGNMIPLLQGTQDLYGYIPSVAFYKISKDAGISLSDMYGVATFYSQFRMHPVGKHIIKVCHGTACHVQDAGTITDSLQEELGVKDGHTTADFLFTLESVACLGCCSLAPVMMIGEDTFGKLSGKSARDVIRDIREKETGTRCENESV